MFFVTLHAECTISADASSGQTDDLHDKLPTILISQIPPFIAQKWDSQDVIEMILRPLGMGHYGAKFDDQNIAGRLLPAITEKELVELGITKVGDK